MRHRAIRPSRPIILALLGLLLAGAGAAAAHAQRPLRAGIEVPFRAESPHPYLSGAGPAPVWSVIVEHPGATYVAVHFDRFELGPGDRVIVRSDSGRQRHAFTGRGKGDLGAFWATHVKGDRAIVELLSPAPHGGAWGVSIDRFAAGILDVGAESTESVENVCGGDDRLNAICYQGTEPNAYDKSRAVARLLLMGQFWCTGWLVGCEGHVMTNNHCIDDPAFGVDPATVAINTDYEFMAEAPTCGSPNNSQGNWGGNVWAGAATLVQRSFPLDYAFIQLAGSPQNTYGALFLEDRPAVQGERIYFPQHPGGFAKEIGIDSDAAADTSGFCEVFNPAGSTCNLPGEPPNVHYFCDSQGGSSGSPILSYATDNVIALHHCGGCPNRGLSITDVIADLGPALPECALAGGANLVLDQVVIDDFIGNKNGFVDPLEIPTLEVHLTNDGAGRATGVSGVLSTTTPGITILDDTATWPTIQALGTEPSQAPHFEVDVPASIPCGTILDFDLALTTDDGPFDLSFQVPVGNGGSCDPVPCFTIPEAVAVPDPVCDGEMTTLDASASGAWGEDCSGVLEYHFSIGGLVLQDWSTDPTVAVTPPASTIYTVKVRDQGTLAEDQTFPPVTVLPVPTASIVQVPDPVCVEFDALTLDAGGGMASYTWRDDASQVVGTSQTLPLGAAACGRTYTVEVDGGSGCTDTAAHAVSCTTCAPAEVSPPGAAVPFRFGIDAAGTLEFELLPQGDVVYHLYQADTVAAMTAGDWTNKYCDLQSGTLGTFNVVAPGTARWTPLVPGFLFEGYWVVIAERMTVEGPYGSDSGGTPRTPDLDGAGSSGSFSCP